MTARTAKPDPSSSRGEPVQGGITGLSELPSTNPVWEIEIPSCYRAPGSPYAARVFQVIFNDISAAEMAALPKDLQLDLLMEFQVLPEDLDNLDSSRFGKVRRDGHSLYRCRAGDYRIYFGKHPDGIAVHRVLHKNTIRDFLYRSNLPMDEEDEHLAQEKGFWKLIEEGEKK